MKSDSKPETKSGATFASLKLIEPLLRAVQAEGYTTPTPVQLQAIPLVLARKDVLACAQTGTGKTAAFALPILQLLAEAQQAPTAVPSGGVRISPARDIRVLVLSPTRELASQIGRSFTDYGASLPFRNTVVFGGVGQRSQVSALKQGVDILVATPGRLLDLMQQRLVQFRGLQILVLDEADRMLDMGFIQDVRRVLAALPRTRQTLFFSATMPPEISKLSDQMLSRPVRIEVTPVASTVEKIDQAIYHVDKRHKNALLIRLLEDLQVNRAIVFTRTKRDANKVSEELNRVGIRADAIHGNKSQMARESALEKIKLGKCRVLVATDVAARGIDIDQVTHVFNHDIPNVPESYVHRIGRTARGGMEGAAISFCSNEERAYLSDIEHLIKKKLTVNATPEGLVAMTLKATAPPRPKSVSREAQSGGAGPVQQVRSVHPMRRTLPRSKGEAKDKSGKPVHANPPAAPDNRRQRRKLALAAKSKA